MADCLGVYIGNNIIKYAKIYKDGNDVKINTSGVKTYSNLEETFEQIVSETDSSQIPISVNVDGEKYNYFSMSSLLNSRDLPKAISTEFESACYDKGGNPNTLAQKYELFEDPENENRYKVVHVSKDKTELNQYEAKFGQKRPTCMTPIALAISNILTPGTQENSIILNIEDKTTATIILAGRVERVEMIDGGMEKIFAAIKAKENSFAKAYEVCKNTTIYTMQTQEISNAENEYLTYIIPELFEIGNNLKDIINGINTRINKVYISGTAAVINNIDLYFNEIIGEEICEILKPFFIQNNQQINIKDCIEANSAIALGLQGLGFGNFKNINFMKKKQSAFAAINKILFMEIGGSKKNKKKKDEKKFKKKININLPSVFGNVSGFIKYFFSAALAAFVMYMVLTLYTANEINKKTNEIKKVVSYTNEQITAMKKDTDSLNKKTAEYNNLTQNLQNAKSAVNEKNSYKNNIPTLLSNLMRIIPKGVQLQSIENPTDKKIIINAQALKYEQLAYFKAELKSEGILQPDTIVSSQAVKTDEMVKIVIEGELP